jgi:hypothetical protein
MGEASGFSREVSVRGLALAVVLVSVLPACGGQDEQAATPMTTQTGTPTGSEIASSGPAPASSIVGTWKRLTTCDERVEALRDAGLGEFAAEHAAGEGWIPGVTSAEQIKDPDHPCKGAVPLEHEHFFTQDGLFGSTDDQGDQVDDGTFRVIDEDTIVIEKEFGDVRFHYLIENDGSLKLDPVMPECARNGCFAAQWAVAMAYPGMPWEPVE